MVGLDPWGVEHYLMADERDQGHWRDLFQDRARMLPASMK